MEYKSDTNINVHHITRDISQTQLYCASCVQNINNNQKLTLNLLRINNVHTTIKTQHNHCAPYHT